MYTLYDRDSVIAVKQREIPGITCIHSVVLVIFKL